MIEHALTLLALTDLPTWEADAPLRREIENLRADVRAFEIASGCDERRAKRKADEVRERADRIRSFIAGRRCGGHAARGY